MTLRDKIQKLANEHPELRSQLIPILKDAGDLSPDVIPAGTFSGDEAKNLRTLIVETSYYMERALQQSRVAEDQTAINALHLMHQQLLKMSTSLRRWSPSINLTLEKKIQTAMTSEGSGAP